MALTIFYIGLSLMFGGVRSQNGPWWFFLPCIVALGAAGFATLISAVLPLPWANQPVYRTTPRRVNLSWRASVRLPAYAPFLLILWHFLSILRMHFEIDWVLHCAIVLVAGIATLIAIRCWREIRLLRYGEVALARIDHRENTGEWSDDRIFYHFRTNGGEEVLGSDLYVGYNVLEGSLIPVFYDARNSKHHLAACASWFEAD